MGKRLVSAVALNPAGGKQQVGTGGDQMTAYSFANLPGVAVGNDERRNQGIAGSAQEIALQDFRC